uniref:Hemocyanin_N domain-containing protein n=1 Tax=Anopheles maculatus TaxID=74869 RepID=A0A182SXG3_9DIPT
MVFDKKHLLLLLDRPREPVFMGKGRVVFDVPDNYLTDRYRPIGPEIQNRFGENAEERIPVRSIALPDLRIPMSLGRQEQFSLFIPRHRKIAARLIDIFMGKHDNSGSGRSLYSALLSPIVE